MERMMLAQAPFVDLGVGIILTRCSTHCLGGKSALLGQRINVDWNKATPDHCDGGRGG
jgi:hypothetical protein